MGPQLHLWLAYASLAVAVLVGLEGAWRALRAQPPAGASRRLHALFLLVIVIATGIGLGMMVGVAGPRDPLHLLYAVVAAVALPLAASFGRSGSPREQGVATFLGALVVVGVIVRLFQTG